MTPSDAVASLRPRPSGPPLRGRAPQSDDIIKRRLFAARDTNRTDADSTLNSLGRGSRLGVGVDPGPAKDRKRLKDRTDFSAVRAVLYEENAVLIR